MVGGCLVLLEWIVMIGNCFSSTGVDECGGRLFYLYMEW